MEEHQIYLEYYYLEKIGIRCFTMLLHSWSLIILFPKTVGNVIIRLEPFFICGGNVVKVNNSEKGFIVERSTILMAVIPLQPGYSY